MQQKQGRKFSEFIIPPWIKNDDIRDQFMLIQFFPEKRKSVKKRKNVKKVLFSVLLEFLYLSFIK